MLTIIAAITPHNIIGNNGTTPWNIPEDLALFKTITTGHTVIMGRKTYESIGKKLPNRNNIVLSRTLPEQHEKDFSICNSIECAMSHIPDEQETFVIGGQQIYAQMMPIAHTLRISHIKADYPGDTFFPEISPKMWSIQQTETYPTFTHITYTRI